MTATGLLGFPQLVLVRAVVYLALAINWAAVVKVLAALLRGVLAALPQLLTCLQLVRWVTGVVAVEKGMVLECAAVDWWLLVVGLLVLGTLLEPTALVMVMGWLALQPALDLWLQLVVGLLALETQLQLPALVMVMELPDLQPALDLWLQLVVGLLALVLERGLLAVQLK
jgi:hypothetical protein